MRISHVVLKIDEGIRRIARTAEAVRLLEVVRRLAAGGSGERPLGLRWDIATEVVAAR